MLDRFSSIIDEIPIPCSMVVDKKGHWDIRDFEKVWANKASKTLFSEVIPRPFVGHINQNKINSMQGFWDQVRQAVKDGTSGFIGPFSNHYINSDMSLIVIEHHILYLGKTAESHPAFFTVVNDKTVEEFKHKIEKPAKTKDRNSVWLQMSDRERHVAELICKGFITKEIADRLGISKRTVDNHRANIRKKLNLPRSTTITEYLGINQ